MGNAWKDGDSSDSPAGESMRLPNEGRDGKAKMTGKAGDRFRFALAIHNEKRGNEMRGGDIVF